MTRFLPPDAVLTLSVLFRGEEMTHFTHEYDKGMVRFLPYLYCVLVRREGTQSVVAGMMVQSGVIHTQTLKFTEVLSALCAMSPPFIEFEKTPLRSLPARVRAS